MNDISDALKSLVLVHDKYQIPGRFSASEDVTDRWPAELPRSSELDVLYGEYEPSKVIIQTGVTPIKLFDVASLKKQQLGYRWIDNPTGTVLNKSWPLQNVVIMDDCGGGKPIVAVTDIEKTPVLASYDVGQPLQVAESLADFILAFSRLVDIVYGEFDIFDISDDNGIDDDFLVRLSEEVGPIVGENCIRNFVNYFYG